MKPFVDPEKIRDVFKVIMELRHFCFKEFFEDKDILLKRWEIITKETVKPAHARLPIFLLG